MPRNPTFSDKIAKIRQKSEIPTRYKHCYHICYIKLMPSFMDTPVIGKMLHDVILLQYASNAFDDCLKLSLNILYFCSKNNKKLYFIDNV